MRTMKLGMSVKNEYEIPTTEVVKMLAEIGFDVVSPSWGADEDIDEQVRVAREARLLVLSLHAPQKGVGHMWRGDDEKAEPVIAEQIECLECCRRNHVPIMVLDATSGCSQLESPEIGLKRFDRIVEATKKKGVKIAFENVQREEHLFGYRNLCGGMEIKNFWTESYKRTCRLAEMLESIRG